MVNKKESSTSGSDKIKTNSQTNSLGVESTSEPKEDANFSQNESFASFFNFFRNNELVLGEDRVIGGVCSGIAERFGFSNAAVRVGWVISLFLAVGFPIYAILWSLMVDKSTRTSAFEDLVKTGKVRANFVGSVLLLLIPTGGFFWLGNIIVALTFVVVCAFVIIVILNRFPKSYNSESVIQDAKIATENAMKKTEEKLAEADQKVNAALQKVDQKAWAASEQKKEMQEGIKSWNETKRIRKQVLFAFLGIGFIGLGAYSLVAERFGQDFATEFYAVIFAGIYVILLGIVILILGLKRYKIGALIVILAVTALTAVAILTDNFDKKEVSTDYFKNISDSSNLESILSSYNIFGRNEHYFVFKDGDKYIITENRDRTGKRIEISNDGQAFNIVYNGKNNSDSNIKIDSKLGNILFDNVKSQLEKEVERTKGEINEK